MVGTSSTLFWARRCHFESHANMNNMLTHMSAHLSHFQQNQFSLEMFKSKAWPGPSHLGVILWFVYAFHVLPGLMGSHKMLLLFSPPHESSYCLHSPSHCPSQQVALSLSSLTSLPSPSMHLPVFLPLNAYPKQQRMPCSMALTSLHWSLLALVCVPSSSAVSQSSLWIWTGKWHELQRKVYH